MDGKCTVCETNDAVMDAEGDCPEKLCNECNSPCDACGLKQCYRCDVPCGRCGKHLCNAHRHIASIEINGEDYSIEDDTYCDSCMPVVLDEFRDDTLREREGR